MIISRPVSSHVLIQTKRKINSTIEAKKCTVAAPVSIPLTPWHQFLKEYGESFKWFVLIHPYNYELLCTVIVGKEVLSQNGVGGFINI